MCWRTWGKETYISFRKTTIVQHQYWTDESAQNIWRQSHIVNKMTALHNYNIIRQHILVRVRVRVMIFNATFNNISAISWQSVLLVEEIKVLGENNRFVKSHSQILSNDVVSPNFEWKTDEFPVNETSGTCILFFYFSHFIGISTNGVSFTKIYVWYLM